MLFMPLVTNIRVTDTIGMRGYNSLVPVLDLPTLILVVALRIGKLNAQCLNGIMVNEANYDKGVTGPHSDRGMVTVCMSQWDSPRSVECVECLSHFKPTPPSSLLHVHVCV